MKLGKLTKRWLCLALCVLLCGCGTVDTENGTPNEPVDEEQVSSMPEEGERNFLEQYEKDGTLPCLSDLYADNFSIGIAIERTDLSTQVKQELIMSQFNSITCGNEMKADYTLSRDKSVQYGEEDYPVVDMTKAEPLLMFASESGMKLRGHTLVWFSQTPRWLFAEGFSDDLNAPLVSKELMLKRMENYIQQVIEYCNENYPGLIYAWDVVNEAIEPSSTEENHLRVDENYWYEVIGAEYIEKAFEYARKYAEPEQKLYYNDYNCYDKTKTFAIYDMAEALKEKGLIDGIGLQSHIGMTYPSISDYEYTITKFGQLGVEIQITELDISQEDNSEEAQMELAQRYKRVFQMYKKLDDMQLADITNVTIWGFTDDRSWLRSKGGPNYPLLFDKDFNAKLAFFGAAMDDSIELY